MKSSNIQDSTIMVVDDDPSLVSLLKDGLNQEGWGVLAASGGEEALKYLGLFSPTVVLLDVMMPVMDGFETCRRIREKANVPVIMLSAKTEEEDKVKCLTLGADDYVTKPFGLRELTARIKVAIGHYQLKNHNDLPLHHYFGDIEIDFESRKIVNSRHAVRLTSTESAILHELVNHAGKVVDYTYLLKQVWGEGCEYQKDYLYVYINYLRSKLEPDPKEPRFILSVSGEGYLFHVPESAQQNPISAKLPDHISK